MVAGSSLVNVCIFPNFLLKNCSYCYKIIYAKLRRYGVEIMGKKFIKKKKSEVAAANTLADLRTTVDKDGNVEIVSKNFTMTTSQQPKKEAGASEWTCWGCGHVNSGEVCEVCGKKRVQK